MSKISDSSFYLAVAVLCAIALLSQDDIIKFVALMIAVSLFIIKMGRDRDPLNRVAQELPTLKAHIDAYTLQFYEQANTAIREQVKSVLLRHIEMLTRFALDIRRDLDSNVLEHHIQARKLMPEVMSVLLDARTKYQAFAGTEAPGFEALDGLKNFVPQGIDAASN